MTDISLYFCIHLVFDELKKLTEQWLSTRKYNVTVFITYRAKLLNTDWLRWRAFVS